MSPRRRTIGRKGLLAALLAVVCLSLVGVVFWQQELKFLLPTPRPVQLVQRPLGADVHLPTALQEYNGKPTLLHFFNPKCPCSRFNLDHVRALQARYGADLQIVAVLQVPTRAAGDEARTKLGLEVPVVYDLDGSIADSCGVYSTPQAVVLTREGKLFYRGNYNKARYCTDPGTEYARLALDVMLDRPDAPKALTVPAEAGIAYGCQLPSDVDAAAEQSWLDAVLK